MPRPEADVRSRRVRRLLAIVIAIAALLRVLGLRFLPHWDEYNIVTMALGFGRGDFNPHFFVYGSLTAYLVFLLYGAMFVVEKLLGTVSSLHDFAVSYFLDRLPFYFVARFVSVAAGLGAVLLVYLIGKKVAGRKAGIIAAALTAVLPELVFRSRLALPDALLGFLTAACLLALMGVMERPSLKLSVAAGLFCGLAAATKALGGLLIVPILATHLMRPVVNKRTALLNLSAALSSVLFATVGFFVGGPYAVIDRHKFFSDLMGFQLGMNRAAGVSPGEILNEISRALLWHNLLTPLGIALGVVGAALVWRRTSGVGRPLVIWAIIYLAFLPLQHRFQQNWLLPLLPALLVFIAVAVSAAIDRLPKTVVGRGAVMALLAAVLIPPTAGTLGMLIPMLTRPDPQIAASQWVRAHVPAGTVILLTEDSIPGLMPSEACLMDLAAREGQLAGGQQHHEQQLSASVRYRLEALRRFTGPTFWILKRKVEWWKSKEQDQIATPFPEYAGELHQDLAWYLSKGVQYAVVRDEERLRYLTAEAEKFPSDYAFYADLERLGRRVASFRGPTIKGDMQLSIYRFEPREKAPPAASKAEK